MTVRESIDRHHLNTFRKRSYIQHVCHLPPWYQLGMLCEKTLTFGFTQDTLSCLCDWPNHPLHCPPNVGFVDLYITSLPPLLSRDFYNRVPMNNFYAHFDQIVLKRQDAKKASSNSQKSLCAGLRWFLSLMNQRQCAQCLMEINKHSAHMSD